MDDEELTTTVMIEVMDELDDVAVVDVTEVAPLFNTSDDVVVVAEKDVEVVEAVELKFGCGRFSASLINGGPGMV